MSERGKQVLAKMAMAAAVLGVGLPLPAGREETHREMTEADHKAIRAAEEKRARKAALRLGRATPR